MKYTCIVWDFNGTILDDVIIGIDSVNVLLKARGLKTLDSREEYQNAFGFPIIDYYRRIGFDFDAERYEDVAVEWVNEYTAREVYAQTVPGVLEMLEYFKNSGVKQVIISACEKEMLIRNAKRLGVFDYFDEICGIDNIYATSKVDIAVDWTRRNQNEKVLFVGDTDHDFTVAKKMGADCVLVAMGHQSYEQLLSFSGGASVIKDVRGIKDLSE